MPTAPPLSPDDPRIGDTVAIIRYSAGMSGNYSDKMSGNERDKLAQVLLDRLSVLTAMRERERDRLVKRLEERRAELTKKAAPLSSTEEKELHELRVRLSIYTIASKLTDDDDLEPATIKRICWDVAAVWVAYNMAKNEKGLTVAQVKDRLSKVASGLDGLGSLAQEFGEQVAAIEASVLKKIAAIESAMVGDDMATRLARMKVEREMLKIKAGRALDKQSFKPALRRRNVMSAITRTSSNRQAMEMVSKSEENIGADIARSGLEGYVAQSLKELVDDSGNSLVIGRIKKDANDAIARIKKLAGRLDLSVGKNGGLDLLREAVGSAQTSLPAAPTASALPSPGLVLAWGAAELLAGWRQSVAINLSEDSLWSLLTEALSTVFDEGKGQTYAASIRNLRPAVEAGCLSLVFRRLYQTHVAPSAAPSVDTESWDKDADLPAPKTSRGGMASPPEGWEHGEPE